MATSNRNLELALKIKALVEGAKDVQQLAGNIGTLQNESARPIPDPTPELRDGMARTRGLVDDLSKSLVGLFTLASIKGFVADAISEFNKAEAGFRGLEAVANASGVGIGRAMEEASRLSADGLISVQEAQKSLQNLLSRGYSLDQAIQTITRLKDAAAFNRAAHLSMGEAVVTATEGLKNENSVLVDNAGVTKNVSVLWKEYAEQVGKSVTDLTQAEKVQAEVNGILRETEAQAGNAETAMNTLGGQTAKATTEFNTMAAGIGQQLAPAITWLIQAGGWVMQNFVSPLIKGVQIIGAAFGAAAVDIGNLWDALRRRDFSDWVEKGRRNAELFRQTVDEIINKPIAPEFQPLANNSANSGGTTNTGTGTNNPAARRAAEKAARDRAAAELALARETIDQAAKLQADDLQRQIAANEAAYKLKLIDARDYYTALTELQRQQAEVEIAALQAQRALVRPGTDAAEQLRAKQELLRIDTQIELVRRRVSDQGAANAQAESAINREALANAQQLVDGLQQEAFLLGLTNDERARAVALLELEKLAVSLTTAEYKRLRAALYEALDARAAAETRKKALEDAKKQAEDIRTALTQNLQRSIADVLDNAFTGDGARGAVKSFVDFLRTSLSNVISAKLTEQILGMLDGGTVQSIGGFLGLGKARDGSNPASAIYVQDVAAAGVTGAGLSAGGDAAGGGFLSSVFDQVKSFFSGIASFVSGLFSRVSSLFSGGGGGGLFSAIGSLFGFAEGGWTGPGGKYQPKGIVHGNEWVSTSEEVDFFGLGFFRMLRNIAHMGAAPRMPRMSYADGGPVNLPAQSAPTVNSSTRIVNLFDPSQVAGQLGQTREFERAVLNVIQLNPSVLR